MEKKSIIIWRKRGILAEKSFLISLTVTLFLAGVFIAVGNLKLGFNVDEIYTFGLSNHQYSESHSLHLSLIDGISYDGEEIWKAYTEVSEDGRFDYSNVFENQTHDVHPPLYYVLIHTVSSLFPGMSVIWIGLLINIPLACVVYWQLVWLACKLGMDRKYSMILSAFYVIGIGFIDNAVVFLRMYALLAVWVNLLSMIFLKFRPEEKGTIRYYVSLWAVLLGGMMTHYYFLIYAFLICAVYAVFVMFARNWKKLIFSLFSAILSGGTGILIFPAVLKQVFSGYRGKEAFDNAITSNLVAQLWRYIDLINMKIFGGLFVAVLVIVLCLSMVFARKEKDALQKECIQRYCLLVIPVCIYVLIIAKIAPYQMLRYVISMSGLLYLAVFSGMAEIAPKRAVGYVLLLAGIMFFCGYRNEIENLYLDNGEKDRQIEAYSDSKCIYVYDEQWRILADYSELRYLDNIIFISEDSWREKKSFDYECDTIITFVSNYLDMDQSDILDRLMLDNGLNTCTELFESDYTKVYCLEQ